MELEKQGVLEEWEDFDDWLEMLTQFAYITFLGPDSPLVIPFSLISNLIEVRSDVVKLGHVFQRPSPESPGELSKDIRAWVTVLVSIAYAGAASNLLGVLSILSGTSNVKVHPLATP